MDTGKRKKNHAHRCEFTTNNNPEEGTCKHKYNEWLKTGPDLSCCLEWSLVILWSTPDSPARQQEPEGKRLQFVHFITLSLYKHRLRHMVYPSKIIIEQDGESVRLFVIVMEAY